MARVFEYALIRLVPFAHRGESLNIGIVVFHPDKADVRLNAPASLISYFNVSQRAIDWIGSRIHKMDSPDLDIKSRFEMLSDASGYTLSEIGWFSIDAESQYELRIQDIISEYVDKPKQLRSKIKPTGIGRELRNLFKEHDVYSKNIHDIENHKIVPNMPVGPSGKLHIDFMLKNSLYHATETLDFKNSDHVGATEIKSAALSSVTFLHAKETHSTFGIKCYLVYSLTSAVEKVLEPAIEIARHNAVQAFNLESRDDKNRYLDLMLEAAGRKTLWQ